MRHIHLLITLIFFSISELYAQFYLDLSPQECFDLIEDYKGNDRFTILDVRTKGEYLPEHIENAFNRDYYAIDFGEQLDSLDKTRVYLIYCRSGSRSGQTLDITQDLKFDTVFNMLGGITEWKADGYPVTDELPNYINLYAQNSNNIEIDNPSVLLFPNPANDLVYIKTKESINKIQLKSLDGTRIDISRKPDEQFIDLSLLHSGIYYLIVETTNKTYINKIVKQ